MPAPPAEAPMTMIYRPPFLIIDADTKRPMRRNKFSSSVDAFNWGDKAYAGTDKDFVVLDRSLNTVPRSAVTYEREKI